MDTKALVLGEIAVREGLLTAEQLEEALRQHAEERFIRPVGEILQERGWLTAAQIETLLERQSELISEFEQTASVSRLFGRLAVEKGFLTEEQLQLGVRQQLRQHARGFRVKIGAVLIQMGLIDIRKFWDVLKMQGDFKCGACSHLLAAPRFLQGTILCEQCSTPVFSVSLDPGGRSTRRLRKQEPR